MSIIPSNLKHIIKVTIANSLYRDKKESLKSGAYICAYICFLYFLPVASDSGYLFLFKAHVILQFIDRYSSFWVHCWYFACVALKSCNPVNVRINFITYILLIF